MSKAAVLTSPKRMEIKDFPYPKLDTGMLLKVDSAGVCGTDVHIYNGKVPNLPYPIIQGHEICGTVEQLPENNGIICSEKLNVGDRVVLVPGISCNNCEYCRSFPHMENYCKNRTVCGINMSSSKPPHLFGGFSEFLYAYPRFWAYKIPRNISPDTAVLIETLSVAMRAVERGFYPNSQYSMGFGIGANMIVQGAGPIGILAALSGKVAGANVIIVDELEHRLKIAKQVGIKNAVNVKQMKPHERIAAVKELTEEQGADLIVECTGELSAVNEGIDMLRRGGRYVEMGHFADVGSSTIKPYSICRNDIEIIGSVIAPPSQFKKALYVMKNYDFPFDKLITHRFGLEQAQEAVENAEKRNGMKTIIKP
ncbi:MAG: zinc-binding dehydrogenase [Candidatus Aenigmarchaeota archaeon]|nr:zinc-binding dehydrogenase [Candidatus Aenigmarchaeota archaeon]